MVTGIMKEALLKAGVVSDEEAHKIEKKPGKGTIKLPYKDVHAHLKDGSNGKSQNKSEIIEEVTDSN